MSGPFQFQLHHVEANCSARRSTFVTPHGSVDLPGFMPVGTLGTVKGLTIDQLRATGAQMILGNTYHLALRPGEQVVQDLGGLHEFSGWDGPILTDSGGFQVFSLAKMTRVTDHGAVFRSHIDGSLMELTPERAVQIQEKLGSDIAMVLDHVIGLPAPAEMVREAMERSIAWAGRCKKVATREDQALFAILQGGLDKQLRQESAQRLAQLDFVGYAIGGLSVGEPPAEMYETLDATTPHMPQDRPRYLMGVGRPRDILEGIYRGVDLFDCVMPSRNGRNGLAFTDEGPVRLRNKQWERDRSPLDPHCPCPACKHGRGYLRHLFQAREMLGPILLTAHNLTYYQRIVQQARKAIEEDRYREFMRGKIAGWEHASLDSTRKDID